MKLNKVIKTYFITCKMEIEVNVYTFVDIFSLYIVVLNKYCFTFANHFGKLYLIKSEYLCRL